MEKIGFNDKLRNLNKNVTLNKAKHLEAEKKLTDLTNMRKYQKKDIIFVR